MRNPFLKIHMFLEGRNLRLPLLIIFYNAILSFVMLSFLVFNAETFQEGFFYTTSPYVHQFLILSSIQIGIVFFLMPFYVSGLYAIDREKHIPDQFAMIPGVKRQYVDARIMMILLFNGLLFISGVPVIELACIYTGLGWQKIIKLGLTILLFSFWSGSIAIFCFSISTRPVWSFATTVAAHFAFLLGTLLIIEILRTIAVFFTGGEVIPQEISSLCLFLLALNPLSYYLGYYGNITGDNGLILFYCSHFGFDASSRWFPLIFYKCSGLACILSGLLFLWLAIKYMRMTEE